MEPVMEKRLEARFRSKGVFQIITGDGQVVDAKVVDTSQSGLGLEAEAALTSGIKVRLHCRGIEVGEGVVQHCRATGPRWFVGILLAD